MRRPTPPIGAGRRLIGWLLTTGLLVWSTATAIAAAREGVPREPQETGETAATAAELSDSELDHRTAELADQLRCLVCRNQSVLESNSRLALEMQDLIREKLAAGDSPEEVKAYFVDRYGDFILLKPRARGVNVLVYVLPVLAFLAGGTLLVWLLRRWSRPAAAASDSGAELSEEERAWLEEALSER